MSKRCPYILYSNKLIMYNSDPIETTVTYDHSQKSVMGWTNDKTIMNIWRKNYPKHIVDNKSSVELRCPMNMFISPKKLKLPVRRTMSEEQRVKASERMRRMHDSKTASVGSKPN